MNVKTAMLLSIVSIFLWPPVLSAHKINLFVWAENNIITVESSLTGGRTMVHGKVTVINSRTEEVILTGENDNNGIFSFRVPDEILKIAPPLDIIVSGGDGHRAHWQIQGDEYGGSPSPSPPREEEQPESRQKERQPVSNAHNCLTGDEFERLLDQRLEQKLAPIRKNVGQLVNHSPSVKDIGAGIGYLVGCAGIIAWVRNRKRKNPQ